MPSRMAGQKRRVEEGGTRNFLAVKGPGIPRGLVQPHLAHVTDIFPTMQELAGVSTRTAGPLDGMSIANLAFGGAPTAQQRDRVVVEMDVGCSADDFVPVLDPKTRRTQKPQPMLDFEKGGDDGLGFKRCLGVRWRDYKWLGRSDQLFLFKGGSHEEADCSAVTDEPELKQRLSSAAKSWFESVVASPHSFERPLFFIGKPGRGSSAVLGNGAAERTPGRVSVLPTGLVGFSRPGDSASWRVHVLTGGQYSLAVGLKSNHKARFRLSLGTPEQLKAGGGKGAARPYLRYEFDADPATTVYRPEKDFTLPVTSSSEGGGPPPELKLEMLSTTKKGSPAVRQLSDVSLGVRKALTEYVPYDVDADEGVGAWREENMDKLARLAGNASGNGNGGNGGKKSS
jgi:hypothetical protein